MWALVIGAALAVIAVAVVLLPFLRSRRDADPLTPWNAEGVRTQREGLYSALETLNLERELGQVDEEEFERQMREYRRQAALLVREQERLLGEAASPDTALERGPGGPRPPAAHGGRRPVRALALALLAVLGPLAAFPVGVGAQVPTGLDGQSPSTLSGTVRNGTAGAAPPIGLRVTLSYQVASGELVEHDTITALDGSFTFTNLPQQGLPGFELRADYLDVEYTNRVLGEPLTGPLDLTVYELTSDFSVLSLVDDTLAVTGADGSRRQFAVLEAARLRNASDRTFRADVLVDGPMSMVRFSLPDGAADLDVESSLPGGHVLQVDRGFALTMPVPPGEHDILFVYRVPYESSTKQYTPNFPMGTDSYRVMVVKGVAESAGPGMRSVDDIAIGDTEYVVLETGPLAPGQPAALMLSALPEPTLLERANTTVRSDGFRRGVLPAAVGLVLVVLVGVILLRRRRSSAHGPMVVYTYGEKPARQRTPTSWRPSRVSTPDSRQVRSTPRRTTSGGGLAG